MLRVLSSFRNQPKGALNKREFASEYSLFSPVGFKGVLSLRTSVVAFSSGTSQQMEGRMEANVRWAC